MAAEARELRPGGETVITRLADILVIQAIRSWIETDPAAQTGWLGALRDRQIGRAIALDPPRSGARVDGRFARAASRHVALGVRGALHRAGRRARHAVRDPLAHASRARARSVRRAPRSRSSRAGSATGRKRRSAARSSASSASHPVPCDERRLARPLHTRATGYPPPLGVAVMVGLERVPGVDVVATRLSIAIPHAPDSVGVYLGTPPTPSRPLSPWELLYGNSRLGRRDGFPSDRRGAA